MKKIQAFIAYSILALSCGVPSSFSSEIDDFFTVENEKRIVETFRQAFVRNIDPETEGLKEICDLVSNNGGGVDLTESLEIKKKQESEWIIQNEQGDSVTLNPYSILAVPASEGLETFQKVFSGKSLDEECNVYKALRFKAIANAFLLSDDRESAIRLLKRSWNTFEPHTLNFLTLLQIRKSLIFLANNLTGHLKSVPEVSHAVKVLECLASSSDTEKLHFRIGLQLSENPDFNSFDAVDVKEIFCSYFWNYLKLSGIQNDLDRSAENFALYMSTETANKFEGYCELFKILGFPAINQGFMAFSLSKWLGEGSTFYSDDSIYGFESTLGHLRDEL